MILIKLDTAQFLIQSDQALPSWGLFWFDASSGLIRFGSLQVFARSVQCSSQKYIPKIGLLADYIEAELIQLPTLGNFVAQWRQLSQHELQPLTKLEHR